MASIQKAMDGLHRLMELASKYVLWMAAAGLLPGMLPGMAWLKSAAIGLLLLAFCFYLCQRAYPDKAMRVLGVAALGARFFLAVCFVYAFDAFGIDSLEYHHYAADMAQRLHNGVAWPAIPVFKQHFTHFIALLYFLFGPNRLLATFIVSFFTVWAGIILHLTCRAANMPKAAGCLASLGIWFMPGFLFFTSDLLKDSVMLFLIALAFYLFALLVYGVSAIPKPKMVLLVLSMVLVLVLSAFIRFYMFLPLIAGFSGSLLLYLITRKGWRFRLLLAALLVLLAAVLAVLSRRHLSQWLVGIDKVFALAQSYRQGAFSAYAAGIRGYDISTPLKALNAFPALCAHFLLQPFPTTWLAQDGAFYIKLLIPDMLLWYALLPFALAGGWLAVVKRSRLGIAVLGYLVIFLGMDALLVGNVGALYRYRLQFQAIGFILAGLGAARFGKCRSLYGLLPAVGLVVCLLLNVVIGLRYADGNIELSESPMALTYQSAESGRHSLRYYINTPKLQEESPPVDVTIRRADTGEAISAVCYNATAKGYANLYFEAESGGAFTIDFTAREGASVRDVKIRTPSGKTRVLAGRYPLLPQWLYAVGLQRGWLAGDRMDPPEKPTSDRIKTGLLPEDDQVVFGEFIRYKGVDVTQTADGTRFDFVFECVAEMENDFTLWMHIFPDDINLLDDAGRPRGYVSGDHRLEVPTDTWQAGQEYRHSYTIHLNEGLYNPQFGFWFPPSEDQKQIWLYTDDKQGGVYMGWMDAA